MWPPSCTLYRAALDDNPHAADDDASQATSEEFRFHIGLAQLAGNALLDLFLRIIVELFRRHWSSTGQEPPARETSSPSSTPTYGFSTRSRPVTTAWRAIAPASSQRRRLLVAVTHAASIRGRFVISSLHRERKSGVLG